MKKFYLSALTQLLEARLKMMVMTAFSDDLITIIITPTAYVMLGNTQQCKAHLHMTCDSEYETIFT